MSTNIDDVLNEMGNADAQDQVGGPNFREGSYDLTTVNLGIVATKRKGPMGIASFYVDAATATGRRGRGADGAVGGGEVIVPNQPGTFVSYKRKLTGEYGDSGQADFIRLCCTLYGITPSDLKKEDEKNGWAPKTAQKKFLEMMVGTAAKLAQPMRGKKIRTEASTEPQKEVKSKDFTGHVWTHVPQSKEELAIARAEVEARGCPKL